MQSPSEMSGEARAGNISVCSGKTPTYLLPAFKYIRNPSLFPASCDVRDYLAKHNKSVEEISFRELALFDKNRNYERQKSPNKIKRKNNKDKISISAELVVPNVKSKRIRLVLILVEIREMKLSLNLKLTMKCR